MKHLILSLFAILATLSAAGQGVGSRVQEKAAMMAENDPHGWTLTIVSVSVVFCALALLWLLFWLLFDRPARMGKAKKKDPDEEVAAAIAAAIHLYYADAVHDSEPYIVTIRPSAASGWNDKKWTFRKLPR